MSATASPVTIWLSSLRQSQQRLAALVTPMTPAEVESPSYASEWSIAQVLSHLGSGAEIFSMFVDAGVQGSPAPGAEQFQPVWAQWNAKRPEEQARDGIRADATFVDQLNELDDAQRDGWRLEMFGGEQRLADVIRLRLGEHALHTWDVAVVLDSDATLPADAVALLIDHLDQLVARAGKAPEQPVDVLVATDEPTRHFRLHSADDAVALTPRDDESQTGDATLRLPAEALIRLVYGRLDPEHTPSIDAEGIDIDTLRRMFPGV